MESACVARAPIGTFTEFIWAANAGNETSVIDAARGMRARMRFFLGEGRCRRARDQRSKLKSYAGVPQKRANAGAAISRLPVAIIR
jgi:hypothetical protein